MNNEKNNEYFEKWFFSKTDIRYKKDLRYMIFHIGLAMLIAMIVWLTTYILSKYLVNNETLDYLDELKSSNIGGLNIMDFIAVFAFFFFFFYFKTRWRNKILNKRSRKYIKIKRAEIVLESKRDDELKSSSFLNIDDAFLGDTKLGRKLYSKRLGKKTVFLTFFVFFCWLIFIFGLDRGWW